MTDYEKLKQVIQEANGREINLAFNGHDAYRLADCWRAVIKTKRWRKQSVRDQARDAFNLNMYWLSSSEDNLDNQSEETKQFLIDLLVTPGN